MLLVREALEASWEPATSYLEAHDPSRPALGQCYPTSRVLQLFFPQLEIVEGVVSTGSGEEKHFWTVLPTEAGGIHLDLTWQQFPHGSIVREWHVRDRDTLNDSASTVGRVEQLLGHVRAYLDSRTAD